MGRWRSYGYSRYPTYVPVATRRAQAKRTLQKMVKKGQQLCPIEITGRTIATSFWGRAWCDNLEAYSDFSNRLPRGRTYVRNGSVVDLQIRRGQVEALVSGSDVYRIQITIQPVTAACWKSIRSDCARSIDSLISLLQGQFSQEVMQRLTRQDGGLFPRPREIKMTCSCPDYAHLCKHLAAVLYGVGARLDSQPQLLFELRGVDHLDLIQEAVTDANLDAATRSTSGHELQGEDLGALFGIELAATEPSPGKQAEPPEDTRTQASRSRKPTGRRSAARPSSKVETKKKTGTNKKTARKTSTKTSARSRPTPTTKQRAATTARPAKAGSKRATGARKSAGRKSAGRKSLP